VVYGIIGAHGGRIDVTSVVGQGTRFDIFLPARVSQDDALNPETAVAA
jgi:signal transduction histidine kinase